MNDIHTPEATADDAGFGTALFEAAEGSGKPVPEVAGVSSQRSLTAASDPLQALILRVEGFVTRTEAVLLTDGPAPFLSVIRQVSDQFRAHIADLDRLRSIPNAPAGQDSTAGHRQADAVDAALSARVVASPDFATGAAPDPLGGVVTDARRSAQAIGMSAAAGQAPGSGHGSVTSGLSPRMTASDSDAADVIAHEIATIAAEVDAAADGGAPATPPRPLGLSGVPSATPSQGDIGLDDGRRTALRRMAASMHAAASRLTIAA